MPKPIQICLTAWLVISAFWGCTDHLSRPLSPLRLRLKTYNQGYSDGSSIATNYVYDSQNRLVTYDRQYGPRGTITYDDQNRHQQIDEVELNSSRRTNYTYQPDAQGTLVTEKQYYDTQVFGLLSTTNTYVFDSNNRLIRSTSVAENTLPGYNPKTTTYTYTNGNITKIEETSGQVVNTTTYEFDDKPNPFYGLATFQFPINAFALNRNNFTRYKSFYNDMPMTDFTFIYEYNAQGLPISRRVDTLEGVDTFVYESY